MSLQSPSNTIQLTATAINADGEPVSSAGQVTFRATDSSVTVSPSGLVTAHFTTQSTQVIAKHQQDNVTSADTAYIRVTATAPPASIATFAIQSSGTLTVDQSAEISPTVQATDSAGQTMAFNNGSANLFWIKSTDKIKQPYTNGSYPHFVFADTGHATLYATSWVYGIAVQDSINVVIGWPLYASTYYDEDDGYLCNWFRCTFLLGVGGVMQFTDNFDYVDRNIIFDDSTAIDSALNQRGHYTGSGNLHFLEGLGGQFFARKFPVAGIYRWHDQSNPSAVGTVIVLNNIQ